MMKWICSLVMLILTGCASPNLEVLGVYVAFNKNDGVVVAAGKVKKYGYVDSQSLAGEQTDQATEEPQYGGDQGLGSQDQRGDRVGP